MNRYNGNNILDSAVSSCQSSDRQAGFLSVGLWLAIALSFCAVAASTSAPMGVFRSLEVVRPLHAEVGLVTTAENVGVVDLPIDRELILPGSNGVDPSLGYVERISRNEVLRVRPNDACRSDASRFPERWNGLILRKECKRNNGGEIEGWRSSGVGYGYFGPRGFTWREIALRSYLDQRNPSASTDSIRLDDRPPLQARNNQDEEPYNHADDGNRFFLPLLYKIGFPLAGLFECAAGYGLGLFGAARVLAGKRLSISLVLLTAAAFLFVHGITVLGKAFA